MTYINQGNYVKKHLQILSRNERLNNMMGQSNKQALAGGRSSMETLLCRLAFYKGATGLGRLRPVPGRAVSTRVSSQSSTRNGSPSLLPNSNHRKLDQYHCSGDFASRRATGLRWQYSAFSIAFFMLQMFRSWPPPFCQKRCAILPFSRTSNFDNKGELCAAKAFITRLATVCFITCSTSARLYSSRRGLSNKWTCSGMKT